MNIIWDTGALSLFFADHDQVKTYMKKIEQNQIIGYVSRLILAEYYYKASQKIGKEIAQIRIVALRNTKIREEIIEEEDIYTIGTIKLNNKHLSLADCILVCIAMKRKATILSTETGFEKIKEVKTIKLEY
ncbi:MAG: PIN domain-containing protein [Candidatus Hodarchaeales archaeon]